MSGCFCSFGDAELPSVYSHARRAARIEHRCCECLEPIARGETYEFFTGCWDGKWHAYKTCLFCARERDRWQRENEAILEFGGLACAIYCDLGLA